MNKSAIIIILSALLVFCSASLADVLLVPSQYTTIQSAINAAVDGDEIIVAVGTYRENIDFKSKNIILTSTDPYNHSVTVNTVISGNDIESVVKFSGTENENCELTGFTITGGKAHHGGGIIGNGTHAVISYCIIRDNYADWHGGGITGCDGTISQCIISHNFTDSYGGGLSFCNGKIIDCVISHNSSKYWGGGLEECNGLIGNCTIVFNNSGRSCGGIRECQGIITNCIVWGNQYEEFFRSSPPTYSCIDDDYSGEGNINADPCFVNAAGGDLHLLPDSPCINTGDPNYVPEPNETDLDGLPRIIGGRVDVGAYEFNHQPVAVAGSNQIAYAWIDGFADVNLDGSASFDDDNDVLDYYWLWTINDSNYEANGVNPTIQLPVGKHEIELIVDDGIDLSEPDYCTITVLRAVRGKLTISPSVLRTRSCGRWIIAILYLPPVIGERINTNEPLRLYPSGIEAKYQRFSKYGMFRRRPRFAVALFDKQQVSDALGPGTTEVSVVGRYQSGRFFFGSNTIKIILTKPKPPHYWHW